MKMTTGKKLLTTIICSLSCLFTACSVGEDGRMDAGIPATISGMDIPSQETDKPDVTEEKEIMTEGADTVKETDTGAIKEEGTDTIKKEGMEAAKEEGKGEEPSRIAITINAAGDMTLGGYTGQIYSGSFADDYERNNQDTSYFLANVQDIFSQDDMTIANLEGPLTTQSLQRAGRDFNIKGDPAYISILKEGSVEAVSFANNHRLDYLDSGAEETMELLDQNRIVYGLDNHLGWYETDKGIVIGFVAVQTYSRSPEVEKILENGISSLKEQGADLIFTFMHWGIERQSTPEPYQVDLGHKCIEWGADLVLGSHPHVVQGIEEYQGKFIVYSLGNFCFGGNRNPVDKDSMIFQQTFFFEDGVLSEKQIAKIIPCSISSVSDRNNYQPTPLAGAEYDRVLEKIQGYSEALHTAFDADGYYVESDE